MAETEINNIETHTPGSGRVQPFPTASPTAGLTGVD